MAMQQRRDDNQGNGFFIDILPELHQRIILAAEKSNLSVQEYIGHILESVVPLKIMPTQEKKGSLNRQAVDDLLEYSEEIRKAHPGLIFDNSVDTLHQLREDRMRELEQL